MSDKLQKIAVFDIDGTLFRWQLFHELVTELTLAKVFPSNTYRLIDDAWQRWRGGEMPFNEYEKLVIDTLITYLPLIPVPTFEAAAKKVVAQSGHKIHYYTHNLLKKLQADGYYTLAISGSQQEVLGLFANRYKFDDCIGAVYERKGGRYTGQISREVYGRKGQLLQEYLESHPSLTLKDSVGIGDSEGDIPMLEMVENPIAFSPSEGLFKEAKERKWKVVVERKNISYTLEMQNGKYILAETVVY